MDIQFSIPKLDGTLLIALSKPVPSLSGHVFYQMVQFLWRQDALHLAFRHTPESPVPFFYSKDIGSDLFVYTIVLTIIVHHTAICLFRHPLLE